jgi:hypothetical protein
VSGTPLQDELARLRADAESASARLSEARRRQERDYHVAAREVTAKLVSYRDAILHRSPDSTPEADRPERERELTRNFTEAIEKRGLVLWALGNGGGVSIIDPSIDREFEEANRALTEAARAVNGFESEHREKLEAERKRSEMERVREALAGDDPDVVREALATSA